MTPRELAFLVVRDTFGEPPRAAQAAFAYRVARTQLDARDRAFAAELAYGTIKARRLLDWWLQPYVGERLAKLPRAIHELLRLGVYQLKRMGSVPAHAAVSDTVGLALRYGHRGTAGLVNAVLRRFAEADPPEPSLDQFPNRLEWLATSASLPTWILAGLEARFGDEVLERIAMGLNDRPQTAVSFDSQRCTLDQALAALAERGVTATPSSYVASNLVLSAGEWCTEDRLPPGMWLQSESAAMAVDLLDLTVGRRVLELCAGRGNKSLALLAALGGEGSLESIERDPRRVEALRERLGAVESGVDVRVLCGDAAESREGVVDAVLVDAPCSGLGVLGRHPEARWRKRPDDAVGHAEMQLAILRAAAQRLADGGRLVYSVCSTDICEGEAVIDRFLHDRPEMRRAEIPQRYSVFRQSATAGDLVVPPGIEGRDGFFIAVLQRQ